MRYRTRNQKIERKALRRSLLIVVALVLLAAVGLTAYYFYSRAGQKPAPIYTKPRPITEKNGSKPVGSTTPSPSAPVNPDNLPAAKPYGSFVSNHKPGQNGSPNEESSVCNTTPGASCTITFTKDGITKSLPAKVTDSSGVAYWPSWTPASVGLTAGNWTVTAMVTWGQQTANTQDPLALQVSP